MNSLVNSNSDCLSLITPVQNEDNNGLNNEESISDNFECKEQLPSEGYSDDLLTDPKLMENVNLKDFVCSECRRLAFKPVICKNTDCMRFFCKPCFERSNECTHCKEKNFRIPRDSELYAYNNLVEIKCRNHAMGCLLVGSILEIEDHLSTKCNFRLYECKHCLLNVIKNNSTDHLNQCQNIFVKCFGCGNYFKRNEINSHECTNLVTEGGSPTTKAKDKKRPAPSENTALKFEIAKIKLENANFKSEVTTLKSDFITSMSENAALKTLVSEIESENASYKSEFATLKSEFATFKSEFASIKSENSSFKTVKPGVETLKSEVANVMSEIANVKSEVVTLRSGVVTAKSEVSNVKSEIDIVKSDIATVKSEISTFKSEIRTELREVVREAVNDLKLHLKNNLMATETSITDYINTNFVKATEILTHYDKAKVGKEYETKYPVYKGIVFSLSIKQLLAEGFVEVYSKLFNHATTSDELMSIRNNNDSNTLVCVGNCKTNTDELILAAFGMCGEVFQETNDRYKARLHNDVYWYFSKDKSFGFSKSEKINLWFADKENEMGSYRSSWWLHGGNGGYRIGETKNLEASTEYEKKILILKGK